MTEIKAIKLFTFDEACTRRQALAKDGRRVVLTNGCFDVLHPGHIFSLEKAKALGDSLWVALNSDASVRALKGPGRPIFSESMRAYMLSAISVIDGIFIFNTPRLNNEILSFRPDVYAKSGDYTIEKLNIEERQALIKVGAKIEFIPFLDGYSTTRIVNRQWSIF